MTQVMRDYVSTSLCRRKIIMAHFDTSVPEYWNGIHMHHCCDNCALSCECDNCACKSLIPRQRNSLRETVYVKYGCLGMNDSVEFSHFFRLRSE